MIVVGTDSDTPGELLVTVNTYPGNITSWWPEPDYNKNEMIDIDSHSNQWLMIESDNSSINDIHNYFIVRMIIDWLTSIDSNSP